MEEAQRKALLLAGTLALHARLVLNANVKNLSDRMNQLENALNEYDNFIISLMTNDESTCVHDS